MEKASKARSEYHSFVSERKKEILEQYQDFSVKQASDKAREEWHLKKNDKGKTFKKLGRPKKSIKNDEKKLNVKRGRPPKNPLMLQVTIFEHFLKQFQNITQKNEIMQELKIDEDIFQLLYKHYQDEESELRKLVIQKNQPKKARGRPKGSKNVSNIKQEKEEKIIIKPNQEIIDFNQNLELFLSSGEEENGDFDDTDFENTPIITPISSPSK